MMKKIVPLVLACGMTYSCFASNQNLPNTEFNQRAVLRRQRRGAQVDNLQASALQSQLIEELHDSATPDDLQSLQEYSRSLIFSRHLVHHFGKPVVESFIRTVEQHDPEEMQIVETHVDQAVNNYFRTQRPHGHIRPASAEENPLRQDAMTNYLVALRDCNSHLEE